MTLYELIHQLQEINYKVTSADFETNVLSVKANLEGDWKNWSVNIHTKDEERLAEEGEELAYNCEKKGYNDAVEKACEWLSNNFNTVVKELDNGITIVENVFSDDIERRFRKAMEE